MKIAVIGGGIAGLSAGYELLLQNHQVTIFEASGYLGGQASTFEVGNQFLEKGYHHLFTSDKDIIQLMNELGIGNNLKWIPSKVGIYKSNKIWNFATPLDLLKFKPLSFISRIRLGLVALYLQRQKNWKKYENVTAHKWLQKMVGKNAYQAVWEPLLRGKFGSQYKNIGMTWFWGKIALRFASREKGMSKELLGYPMGSFRIISDRLSEKILDLGGNIHTNTNIHEVIIDKNICKGIRILNSDNSYEDIEFDAVLSTAPSHVLPKIAQLPEHYAKNLNKMDYLTAVLVVLSLNKPLSEIYWLNVADEDIPFVGVIEHTNFISPEHYDGNHIVYFSNYLSKDHHLYSKNLNELLEIFIPAIKKINPEFDENWINDAHYFRVEAAQPIITKNYSELIPNHRTPIQNLYLANTTQIYPEDRGTNYSVRIGRKIAHMILEDHNHKIIDRLPAPVIANSFTNSKNF